MHSTDNILISLYSNQSTQIDRLVPSRDRKILFSLFRQITSGQFLTENQGKLLVKIFKENLQHFQFDDTNTLSLIETPIWSQPFRRIEQIKNLYISDTDEKQLIIEFTFNKRIREQISKISKDLDGMIVPIGNKKLAVPLTEKNILLLVKGLKNYNFNIDQKVADFFQEISEILKNSEDLFSFENLENDWILKKLEADIGESNLNNRLLIADRKIRYQYRFSENLEAKTLTEKLALRRSTKLYLNKTTFNLADVVSSLIELKRLPILFIFSSHTSTESYNDLMNLSGALEKNSITDNIGIYFRFDNSSDENKSFNDAIPRLGYNSRLDDNINVVGLSNNKLPKFIVKNHWRPKSIISFTNTFKNNKTSVYCDNVDLIIYYHDREPLGDIDVVV